eukprot:15476906-Alexandrium_andersonii.AAC.1
MLVNRYHDALVAEQVEAEANPHVPVPSQEVRSFVCDCGKAFASMQALRSHRACMHQYRNDARQYAFGHT